jgi:hypothetical protein
MHGARTIRLVDVEAAGGVDTARLERALTLAVERTDRGRYRVSGGAEPHHVDLVDPAMERCDCADFLWRQRVCAHLLACLLREGDERVVRAAAQLVARLTDENRRLRTTLHGRTIVLTRALRARVAEALGTTAAELAFRRDPARESSDLTVVRAATDEVLGRLTRVPGAPELVPARGAGGAGTALPVAA